MISDVNHFSLNIYDVKHYIFLMSSFIFLMSSIILPFCTSLMISRWLSSSTLTPLTLRRTWPAFKPALWAGLPAENIKNQTSFNRMGENLVETQASRCKDVVSCQVINNGLMLKMLKVINGIHVPYSLCEDDVNMEHLQIFATLRQKSFYGW